MPLHPTPYRTPHTITNNPIGTRISDSTLNHIAKNTFIENTGFAIVFSGNQKDNIIHHNNFIKNNFGSALQVAIDKINGPGLGNTWSDGGKGNYWSDYLTRYASATEIAGTKTGNPPLS